MKLLRVSRLRPERRMAAAASPAQKTRGADLRWLFVQLRPYFRWQVFSIVFVVLSSVASLTDPLILKWLIDTVLPQRDSSRLLIAAGLMFASFGGRVMLGNFGGWLTFTAKRRFLLDLRVKLLAHLTALSADHHERTPVGASMYIVGDVVDELGTLTADFFPLLVRTFTLAIITLTAMLVLNARLTITVLPFVPVFLYVVRRFRRRLTSASELVQQQASAATSCLQEQLSSVVQIQLLTRERLQIRRAFHAWGRSYRATARRKRAELDYSTFSNLIVVAGIVAMVVFGGFRVLAGGLTIGGFVAFYSYLGRLFDPLYFTADMNARLPRVIACIRRIRDLLETVPAIVDAPSSVPMKSSGSRGEIRIENVVFGYRPDAAVIHVPYLRIGPGEKIALIGASGCGKSTLAKLVARLYDVNAGSLRIDGLDVREVLLKSLRAEVCYVPQQTVLFDCDMEENLRLGAPNASMAQLERAAEIAGLVAVLERLPHGWRESLGAGGGRLSGGERQRVAIARAILRRPRVMILDESTGELDAPSESAILESVRFALPEATLIAISHRLAALTWVDRMLIMRDGSIIEAGTHGELYENSAVYTNLFHHQGAALERCAPGPSAGNGASNGHGGTVAMSARHEHERRPA